MIPKKSEVEIFVETFVCIAKAIIVEEEHRKQDRART